MSQLEHDAYVTLAWAAHVSMRQHASAHVSSPPLVDA